MINNFNRKWPRNFMDETTLKWSRKSVDPRILGWQIQPDTSWLPGYSEEVIQDMERFLSWPLPFDVKTLLRDTSGLDKPQVHLGTHIKEDQKYKNQWMLTLENIQNIRDWFLAYNNKEIYAAIREDEIVLPFDHHEYLFLPVYAHRCVACRKSDLDSSAVLSISGSDVVQYGENLQTYLENEFLMK
ncbi:MAG: hypothetical protein AAB588_04115 [Patescibacteria group bacterium]